MPWNVALTLKWKLSLAWQDVLCVVSGEYALTQACGRVAPIRDTTTIVHVTAPRTSYASDSHRLSSVLYHDD